MSLYQKIIKHQPYFLLLLVLILVPNYAIANSYQKYVGQGFSLPFPTCPVSNGYINSYSYSSSNANIEIDQNGYARITSYFSGTATVECFFQYMYLVNNKYWQAGTRTEYHQVSCLSNNNSISAPKSTLNVGETMQMKYSFSSSTNGISPQIKWSSNSSAIAINSSSGYVEARSSGTATITATSNLGSNVASCTVTVQKVDPTSVSIPYSLIAYVGEYASLNYTLYPSNAQTSLSWYSNDQNVATVSGGSVWGVGEGTTTVYCRTSNGLTSNDCNVTVKYRVPTGIKMSEPTLYVPLGQSKQLKGDVTPSNARYTLKWKSEDDKIATVDQNGWVTSVGAGKTRIKVETDNGYSAYSDVTVPPNPETISIPSKVSMYRGDSRAFKATVLPADAYISLRWSSNDESVATVNQEGKIVAVNPGTATITAETSNGKTSKCIVEVPKPDFQFYIWGKDSSKSSYSMNEHPKFMYKEGNIILKTNTNEIIFSAQDVHKFTMMDDGVNPIPSAIVLPESCSLSYKKKTQLEYSFLPADYDVETKVKWTSSDPSIVSINDKGEIRAKYPGTVTITSTTENGKKAECQVSVPEPHFYFVLLMIDNTRKVVELNEHPKIVFTKDKYQFSYNKTQEEYDADKVWKFFVLDEDGMAVVEDFNGDGTVDVLDVEILADIILNKRKSSGKEDVNKDGRISISDISKLIQRVTKK